MPSIIVLDTGPLSNCVVPSGLPGEMLTPSQQCRKWIEDCEQSGVLLLVPAICYYETRRELERRNAAAKMKRLEQFVFSIANRYIPLTTAHLEEAARLWGVARNSGRAMASVDALDADVILCAQALSLGLSPADYVVATTNVSHLSQFVSCAEWSTIVP